MSLTDFTSQKAVVAQAARRAVEALAPLPASLKPDTQATAEAIERLETGRFQVAFIGQMKAGKSSLVNALIFGRQVLPVSPTPHTARLSVVRHGPVEKATVQFLTAEEWRQLERQAAEQTQGIRQAIAEGLDKLKDAASGETGEREKTLAEQLDETRRRLGAELPRLLGTQREIPLTDLPEYCATTSDVDGRYVGITREIAVEAPHRWPEEVEFVDTPGLFDPVRSRSQVTLDYLKRADAVVFIVYSGAPMSRKDAEFLAQVLLPVGVGKVIVTLNKWDTIAPEQRGDVKNYVRGTLRRVIEMTAQFMGSADGAWRQALDTAEVHATSSMLALLGRSRGTDPRPDTGFHWRRVARTEGLPAAELDEAHTTPGAFEAAIAASGIEPFEGALGRMLVEQKGRILLNGPLNKAEAALATATRSIEAQRSRVTQKRADLTRSAAQLETEIAARRADRQRLDKGLTEVEAQLHLWTNEATRGLDKRLIEKLDAAIGGARRRGEAKIDAAGLFALATSQEPVTAVNLAVQDALTTMARDLNAEIRRVFDDLRRSISDRMRGTLQTQVGNVIPSLQLDLAIDGLERAAFEFEDRAPAAVVDDLGFWGPIFNGSGARQTLKKRLVDALTSYRKSWEAEIKALPGLFSTAIAAPFAGIQKELRATLAGRIEDIERAIADRQRTRPALEAEQAQLDAEDRALADHAGRIATARIELGRARSATDGLV